MDQTIFGNLFSFTDNQNDLRRQPVESQNAIDNGSKTELTLPKKRKRKINIGKFNCSHCDYKANNEKVMRSHNDMVHLKLLKYFCNICQYKCYMKASMKSHMKHKHKDGQSKILFKIGCNLCENNEEHETCQQLQEERLENTQEKSLENTQEERFEDTQEKGIEDNKEERLEDTQHKTLEDTQEEKLEGTQDERFESTQEKRLEDSRDGKLEDKTNKSGKSRRQKEEVRLEAVEALLRRDGDVWRCKECGKTKGSKCQLRLHAEGHIQSLTFECKLCEKSFNNRVKLACHKWKYHSKKNVNKEIAKIRPDPSKKIGILKCHSCEKSFKTRTLLAKHKWEQHSLKNSLKPTKKVTQVSLPILSPPFLLPLETTSQVVEDRFDDQDQEVLDSRGLIEGYEASLRQPSTWPVIASVTSLAVPAGDKQSVREGMALEPNQPFTISKVPLQAKPNAQPQTDTLKQQKQMESKVMEFKCDICEFTTKHEAKLKQHENGHFKMVVFQPQKCKTCDFISRNPSEYKKHLKSHSDRGGRQPKYLQGDKAGQFKCTTCEYSSVREQSLKYHVDIVHLKVKKYFCKNCSFKSYFKKAMGIHMKSNHDEENLIFLKLDCSLCVGGETHDKCTDLQPREPINTEKKQKYFCILCFHRTYSRNQMKFHMKTEHQKVKMTGRIIKIDCSACENGEVHTKCVGKFECNQCEFIARRGQILKAHVDSKHLLFVNYFCKRCPYKCYSKSNMKQHMKSEHMVENERVYKIQCLPCRKNETHEACNGLKKFAQKKIRIKAKGKITKTIIIGSQIKFKYSCNICDFKSLYKEFLRIHAQIEHFGNNVCIQELQCLQCDSKQYHKTCSYEIVKPDVVKQEDGLEKANFQCPDCDFKGSYGGASWEHTKAVHKQAVRFSCSECEFQAFFRPHLKEHQQINHQGTLCKIYTNDCQLCVNREEHKSCQEKRWFGGLKELFCNHCEDRFETLLDLRTHEVNVHDINANFRCNICEFKAFFKFQVQRHVKSDHVKSSAMTVKIGCIPCETNETGHICKGGSSHLKKSSDHNDFKLQDIKCDVCGFLANNTRHLTEHKLIVHERRVNFQCSICNYKSFKMNSITKHRAQICEKTYKEQYRIIRIQCEPCDLKENHEACPRIKTAEEDRIRYHSNRRNVHQGRKLKERQQQSRKSLPVRRNIEEDPLKIHSSSEEPFKTESYLEDPLKTGVSPEGALKAESFSEDPLETKACTSPSNDPPKSETELKFYESMDPTHWKAAQNGIVRFACSVCDYKAFCSSSLKTHQSKYHEDEQDKKVFKIGCKCMQQNTDHKYCSKRSFEFKPCKCSFCDFSAMTSHTLRKHVEMVHKNMLRYQCGKCDYRAYYKLKIERHCQSSHDLKEPEILLIICRHCQDKTDHRDHEYSVSTKTTKYAWSGCSFCEQNIKHDRHSNWGEKMKERSQRRKAIKENVKIQKKKTPKNEGDYQCISCDYKARGKQSLKEHHDAVHLKIVNYLCKMCDFRSYKSTDMKYHLQSMHMANNISPCRIKCKQCRNSENHEMCTDIKVKKNKKVQELALAVKTQPQAKIKRQKKEKKIVSKSKVKDKEEQPHFGELKQGLYYCTEGQCTFATKAQWAIKLHYQKDHYVIARYSCSLCDFVHFHQYQVITHQKLKHDGLEAPVVRL